MRDRWYGDNRDLAKWGVLLQLASNYTAFKITQVAYYRSETISIHGGGTTKSYPIANAVLSHFRRKVTDIVGLSAERMEIEVIEDPVQSFDSYTKLAVGRILGTPRKSNSPLIVFLDPDSGLEPEKSRPQPEHVRICDLQRIWTAMREMDVLVLYQHRFRGRLWAERKRKQFENALQLSGGLASVARGSSAEDVVFLFAQKPASDISAGERQANEPLPNLSQAETRTVCPECNREFRGSGFGGIDAHWRSNHEEKMPYEKAWPLIKLGKYPK
jgi:hypothetical protein